MQSITSTSTKQDSGSNVPYTHEGCVLSAATSTGSRPQGEAWLFLSDMMDCCDTAILK